MVNQIDKEALSFGMLSQVAIGHFAFTYMHASDPRRDDKKGKAS